MLRLGIVGLPNVGKSTLFNALTSSRAAAAENYPFCTVEPNVGVVEVPDPRLEQLNALVKPKKKVPAVVEFVDIAGLVRGASQGEGLGNQFLSHIREVDAVVHVIRCFDDPDVVHVMGPVDPVRDHDVITSELALADLAVVDRRLDKTRKTARAGDKDAQAELVVLERVLAELNAGRGAREAGESEEAVRFLRQLGLLTAKPILYAANVNEPDLAAGGGRWLDKLRAAVLKMDLPVGSLMNGWGVKFDESGQNSNERVQHYMLQWQNGQLVSVWPEQFTSNRAKWTPLGPWNQRK